MNLIQITMIVSATTMLLISVLLVLIGSIPSRPGIKWWVLSTLMQTISFLIGFAFFESESTTFGAIVFYLLGLVAAFGLSTGTLLFANVSVNVKQRIGVLAIAIALVTELVIYGHTFMASLCFALYNAFYLFSTAKKIYSIKDNSVNFKIPAMLMIINAIHWLDFPFLSQVEWFVPIGFMFGMVLLNIIFLNLSICALLQFIEQTKESERLALQASTYDSLTGLYNRGQLEGLFDNYAKEANQLERSFILLYFDLDGFKQINDSYGHKCGDLILKTVAERMTEWLGNKGDAIRIGGDELVVLTKLSGVYERENAVTAAKRLLALIEEPIYEGDHRFEVSASIGGCCYGVPLCNLDDMLNKADKLMYVAKQAGGKQVYFSHSQEPCKKSVSKNMLQELPSKNDDDEQKLAI